MVYVLASRRGNSRNPGIGGGRMNWRSHLLVKCARCKRLMGYHKESNTSVCTECELKVKKS